MNTNESIIKPKKEKEATLEEQPLDEYKQRLIDSVKEMNVEEIIDALKYIELLKLRKAVEMI